MLSTGYQYFYGNEDHVQLSKTPFFLVFPALLSSRRMMTKQMFTTTLFFVETFFVIWLVTVMHGCKDGVLLALKLFWNRFELFFGVKTSEVWLCLLLKVISNCQKKNLNKQVLWNLKNLCKVDKKSINFILFRWFISSSRIKGSRGYGIRKRKRKTVWCYQG